MKTNKSILQQTFLDKFHFLQFQKSTFELGKSLKLPKMQFHVKKIFDLFDFTSFFPWSFLNFLAHCATSRSKIKKNLNMPIPTMWINFFLTDFYSISSLLKSTISFIHSFLLLFFQWNGKTLYDFKIPRDFGTDYGICCWHTPQMNLTEVYQHQIDHNLTEPHWGEFFTNVQKVS